MCMTCFSGAEATVVQGAAGVMFAKSEFTRLYGVWTGADPDDLRQSAYDANAEFVTSLGLDADIVLGPRPEAARPRDIDE